MGSQAAQIVVKVTTSLNKIVHTSNSPERHKEFDRETDGHMEQTMRMMMVRLTCLDALLISKLNGDVARQHGIQQSLCLLLFSL